MKVNHVMSTKTHSPIFSDILSYFHSYAGNGVEIFVSQTPQKDMDVYHYHRPQFEKNILPNSVITVHHDLEDCDSGFDLNHFLPAYRQANHLVCLANIQRRILQKNGLHNISIIPHGFNHRYLQPKEKRADYLNEKLTLGFISKRYARRVKGEAYFLELLKRISSEDYQFLFVGEGRSEEAHLAQKFGFKANVFERLPYRTFGNLYAQMDFLLILSHYEGGPAAIPEAIATGTPVLTTKVGMAIDFVVEGINGFFLSQNAEKDSQLLQKIACNKHSLLKTLNANAKKKSNRAITWEENVKKHIALYKKIVPNPKIRYNAKVSINYSLNEPEFPLSLAHHIATKK